MLFLAVVQAVFVEAMTQVDSSGQRFQPCSQGYAAWQSMP
jgi:hypothetical protein